MNVIHIIHWPRSGIASFLYGLLAILSRASTIRTHVVFLIGDNDVLTKFQAVTERTYALNHSVYSVAGIMEMRTLMQSLQPDIIHVHSFLPHLCALLSNVECPVVRTIHSDYPYFHSQDLKSLFKRVIERALLRRSHCVTAVSQSLTARLSEVLDGVSIHTIYNGITPSNHTYDRSTVRRELGIPDSETVFISVGRLEHQKGYDILLESFEKALNVQRGICLLIVGEGTQFKRLQNQIVDKGLTEHIRLLGFRKDPLRLLSASDIYITSARYEGYGLAVVEAQSVGLPVIGFEVTGVEDVVLHKRTGVLSKDIDPDTLSDMIVDSSSNLEQVKKMGQSAKRYVSENFNLENTAKEYIDAYKKLQS